MNARHLTADACDHSLLNLRSVWSSLFHPQNGAVVEDHDRTDQEIPERHGIE